MVKRLLQKQNFIYFIDLIIDELLHLFAKLAEECTDTFRQTILSLPWRRSPANALKASGVYESESFFCTGWVLFSFARPCEQFVGKCGPRVGRKILYTKKEKFG